MMQLIQFVGERNCSNVHRFATFPTVGHDYASEFLFKLYWCVMGDRLQSSNFVQGR